MVDPLIQGILDAHGAPKPRDELGDLKALLLPFVSDLNNIVEAIEEEGDRTYFGSTNDAERLRIIAQCLDDWRFESMSGQSPTEEME